MYIYIYLLKNDTGRGFAHLSSRELRKERDSQHIRSDLSDPVEGRFNEIQWFVSKRSVSSVSLSDSFWFILARGHLYTSCGRTALYTLPESSRTNLQRSNMFFWGLGGVSTIWRARTPRCLVTTFLRVDPGHCISMRVIQWRHIGCIWQHDSSRPDLLVFPNTIHDLKIFEVCDDMRRSCPLSKRKNVRISLNNHNIIIFCYVHFDRARKEKASLLRAWFPRCPQVGCTVSPAQRPPVEALYKPRLSSTRLWRMDVNKCKQHMQHLQHHQLASDNARAAKWLGQLGLAKPELQNQEEALGFSVWPGANHLVRGSYTDPYPSFQLHG